MVLGVGFPGGVRADGNWLARTGGDIPWDAVVGGNESDGTRLYICHAEHGGGVHPGKIRPEFGGCSIPVGGRELIIRNYEVLVPEWVSASGGVVPMGAVVFGSEAPMPGELFGRLLYICRASYQGATHPGKLRPELRGCSIPWHGRELTVPNYDVLVNPKGMPILRLNALAGGVPQYTLVGGRETDGNPFYLCSAPWNGGLHPGKLRPEFGGCNIPWGGGEITITSYQVLTTEWRGSAFALGFPGGHDRGSPLYVCHGRYNGGVHPGKFSTSLGCRISWGGAEISIMEHELLAMARAP
jgi:hypothetical protein